jgi:ferritin-like metal-binding protein YciE
MAKTTKKAAANKRSASRQTPQPLTTTDPMLLDFFKDELKDVYWAEKKLVSTLPKMQRAATSPALKKAFEQHTAVTREHVRRLEAVFSIVGKKAQAKKCEAMSGIVKEGEEIIEDTEKGTATRDVGLILAAQKAEHYEIATYGGLTALATTLGLEKAAKILHATLEDEKHADTALSQIAQYHVNYAAAQEAE